MKKVLMISVLLCSFFIYPGEARGYPPDFAGGVNNEYEYEEIVFLSGEPVKFTGKVTVSEKGREEQRTISYNFSLRPQDKDLKGKLDRRVSYEIKYEKYSQGQTTAQCSVKSYRESIEIGGNKYTLSDYQLSKADVIDNRPASDFYSGTIVARKYYSINKDKGTTVLEFNGGTSGYSNFWGSTETQMLDYNLSVNETVKNEAGESRNNSWEGTVKVMVSDSMRKSIQYSENNAVLSSFAGGHMIVSSREMFSRYEYNLPLIEEGIAHSDKRRQGQSELCKQMLPKVERLIIPKFRDIGGHWAEENIRKLYALNIFTDTSPFFIPDIPINRADFIKAVVKASNIEVLEAETSRTRSRQVAVEAALFEDVLSGHPDYRYIKEAVESGLITGTANGYFMPGEPLTRAQAVTILVRALGFEYNAPAPGYSTTFADDRDIPDWARDSIYVAQNIGLIQGDQVNKVYPNRVMSRAEASAMLDRFLNFLERDLQRDYRENIVLYN